MPARHQGRSLRFGSFVTPLRFRFNHASASRRVTSNVIVQVMDEAGLTGYGEGCPRDYVTGETVETAETFLSHHGQAILTGATTLVELKAWIAAHTELIDKNPAAFCAIETALLDLFARQASVTLEKLLDLPQLAPQSLGAGPDYTAVIGKSGPLKMQLMCLAYRLYGFNDFKVKLSGDPQLDERRLAKLPAGATLRLDANNYWHQASDCIQACKQLSREFWAIEEPVQAFDTASMIEVGEQLQCRIILDESLLNASHMDLYSGTDCDRLVANIRVSKCGGILRTLELIRLSQQADMGVILGAHVGETSLLTRAALVVGQGISHGTSEVSSVANPIAREGAYGKILLKRDICIDDLRFGRRGCFDVSQASLRASGNGLQVKPERISWKGEA